MGSFPFERFLFILAYKRLIHGLLNQVGATLRSWTADLGEFRSTAARSTAEPVDAAFLVALENRKGAPAIAIRQ
jgi:hypothetical protein